MDEHTITASPALMRWRALGTPAKVVLALVALLGALIIVSLGKALFFNTASFGVMDGADMYYGGGMGVASAPAYPTSVQNAKVSSRVAMEYDESYYPTPYPTPGGVGGYEESEYETHAYTAHIKTREYDVVCDTIERWKPLTYIVFEQANRSDLYCTYRFKVQRDSVAVVLTELTKLNPRDLNEQTEVVQRQLLEYTSELDILQKREALLTKTLDDVSAAYDELVALSKDARDVETLAKVIDGKLNYIERLSQQRLQVASQIDAIARTKADLTDRIEFVYFDVSVEKVEFVDGEQLRDSWTYAVRTFVTDMNDTVQQITFGVFTLILWLIQFFLQAIIVFVVVLVVAKYGWRLAREFWKN